MQYLPTKWDILLDWWYHNLHPVVMGELIDTTIIEHLHFGVMDIAADVCGKHPGAISPEDVAKISPEVFRQRGFNRPTMQYLADVLRFSKRSTPGGWSKQTKAPVLSVA